MSALGALTKWQIGRGHERQLYGIETRETPVRPISSFREVQMAGLGREHLFPGRESCRSILVADEGRLTTRLPPDAENQANGRSGRTSA